MREIDALHAPRDGRRHQVGSVTVAPASQRGGEDVSLR